MDTPRGYNPVGQSAPGLPRHDAPLPGHVPGQYQPLGGSDDGAWTNASYNVGYKDPGFPPWFGVWSGRLMYFVATYITLPIQAALYPIAGAAGLAAGGAAYLLLRAMGAGIDRAHDWAWTACFLGLVALMRMEIRTENSNPGYRMLRQWLRLGTCFVAMFYVAMHEQRDSAGTAFVISAIFTAIMFFVMRSRWLGAIWHGLQTMAWMRQAPASAENPAPSAQA